MPFGNQSGERAYSCGRAIETLLYSYTVMSYAHLAFCHNF